MVKYIVLLGKSLPPLHSLVSPFVSERGDIPHLCPYILWDRECTCASPAAKCWASILLVLSIWSLYPLRSGSFLCCNVHSARHWRGHICCEIDDSWVCIFFRWSVAWAWNGCQQDLLSGWLRGTTETGWQCSFWMSGVPTEGPPALSPQHFVSNSCVMHKTHWFQRDRLNPAPKYCPPLRDDQETRLERF